jgi:hypothetical protein
MVRVRDFEDREALNLPKLVSLDGIDEKKKGVTLCREYLMCSVMIATCWSRMPNCEKQDETVEEVHLRCHGQLIQSEGWERRKTFVDGFVYSSMRLVKRRWIRLGTTI